MAAAPAQRFFKPEHVFLIGGHGEDTGQRFELHEGQYGAIPTLCGSSISYKPADLYDFFTSHSDSSTQIPIPDESSSLKDVSKMLAPSTYMIGITIGKFKRSYKIYRPKVAGNSEKTRARWTMPELNITPFSIWFLNKTTLDIPTENGETRMVKVKRIALSLSGVFPATDTATFKYKGDASDAELKPEEVGFDVYPFIEVASYHKTLNEIMNDSDNPIMYPFFERIQESMSKSFIPFDSIVLVAWLNKIIKRNPNYKGSIRFDHYNEIASDETSYSVSLSVAYKELTMRELLKSTIPLSFIYDYIASKVSEPFLVLAPVCRGLPNSMTRREKARVRRYSRNFSGDVLAAGAAVASNAEGGRRYKKTRRRRRT